MAQVNGIGVAYGGGNMRDERDQRERAALAAYANLAQHNVYVVLNDVAVRAGGRADKTGFEAVSTEGGLKAHPVFNILRDKKQARAAGRVMRGLERAFPFLWHFQRQVMGCVRGLEEGVKDAGKGAAKGTERGAERGATERQQVRTVLPEDYAVFFKALVTVLHDLRNGLTHAGLAHAKSPLPVVVLPPLVRMMEDIYDAAVRRTKVRHGFEEGELKLAGIRRRVANPKYKPREKERMKRDGVKPDMDNPDFYRLTVEEGGALTRDGILFLLCLLLGRGEGFGLLKQMRGFKDARTRAKQVRPRVFTHYGLRVPFQRLDAGAEVNADALVLDMLGELSRCPDVLYEQLSDEARCDFQAPLEERADAPVDDSGEAVEEGGVVPLIRHGERFVPLMLEFLERDEALVMGGGKGNKGKAENRAFAVDVGDFYFAAYGKTLYAGEGALEQPEVRRLRKKVVAFAHLHKRNAWVKPAGWQALEASTGEDAAGLPEPYIVPTRPHYHLPDENIAICLSGVPYFEPELREMPAGERRYVAPKNEVAEFCLSQRELVFLSFYHLLYRKHGEVLDAQGAKEKIEGVPVLLMQYRRAVHQVFKDVQNGVLRPFGLGLKAGREALAAVLREEKRYHFVGCALKVGYLPEVLVRYLCGVPTRRDRMCQAKETVRLLQVDNERRLRTLARGRGKALKGSRPGERRQWVLKSGEMADFMARDMLRLQPVHSLEAGERGRGKANSLLFGELQARLAHYGRDKRMLRPLCVSMGLVEGAYDHPFLGKVLNQDFEGVIGFYEAYLLKRKAYLERVARRLEVEGSVVLQKLRRYVWLVPGAVPGDAGYEISVYLDRLMNQDALQPGKIAMNLPRGLFEGPILALLGRVPELRDMPGPAAVLKVGEADAAWQGWKVIQAYFEYVRRDRYPVMYDLPRNYRLIDQCFDRRRGKKEMYLPLVKQYVAVTPEGEGLGGQRLDHGRLKEWLVERPNEDQVKSFRELLKERGEPELAKLDDAGLCEHILAGRRRRYREFLEAERNLRRLRMQDEVLFMAGERLWQGLEIGKGLADLRLQGIGRDMLQRRVRYGMPLPVYEGVMVRRIEVGEIRVRDLGRYRHVLRSRLLPGLLGYCGAEVVAYGDLRAELDDYEQVRLAVFRRLLAFEAEVASRDGGRVPEGIGEKVEGEKAEGENAERDVPEESKSRHGQVLDRYFGHDARGDSPDELRRRHEMLVLRNAFCHNEYPDFGHLWGDKRQKGDGDAMKYKGAKGMLDEARATLRARGRVLGVAKWFEARFFALYGDVLARVADQDGVVVKGRGQAWRAL